MKRLSYASVLLGLSLLTLASCSRYAATRRADPTDPKYAPTRSLATPSNTGDNTSGHQNREIRANDQVR